MTVWIVILGNEIDGVTSECIGDVFVTERAAQEYASRHEQAQRTRRHAYVRVDSYDVTEEQCDSTPI